MINIPKQKEGYKRVMGEIPEDIYEKITQYNKISARPLNVSKAIELCITQAWGKIEEELLKEASGDDDGIDINSAEIYKEIKKDLDEGKLNSVETYKHFIKLLKKEDFFNDLPIKWLLYPVDKVQHAGTESDPCTPIVFYARDIHCITLYPESCYGAYPKKDGDKFSTFA